MHLLKQSLLVLLASAFLGCATPLHTAFPQLKLGADKSSVVEILGSPKHSVRRDGKDFWVYRYYREENEYKRTLVFESSHLIEIGNEERLADPREALIERDLENMSKSVPAENKFEEK